MSAEKDGFNPGLGLGLIFGLVLALMFTMALGFFHDLGRREICQRLTAEERARVFCEVPK